MGILSRTFAVLRAHLNALLDRAEDPAKMLEQTLLDMDQAFRRAKEQVARAVADEKRLERQRDEQRGEMARWEERALRAVETDDDELAREALRRKQEHERLAARFAHELAAHGANVEQLRGGLRDLESRIAELRRRKELIISRQKRAEAQSRIYRTLEGIRSAGAVDTIQRMETKVEEMGHLADARMELSGTFQGDRLEQRFAELDRGGDVEQELLALKERRKLEHHEP